MIHFVLNCSNVSWVDFFSVWFLVVLGTIKAIELVNKYASRAAMFIARTLK